jgi:hypothetical protein
MMFARQLASLPETPGADVSAMFWDVQAAFLFEVTFPFLRALSI